MLIDVDFGNNCLSWQFDEKIEGELTISEDANCSFKQFLRISSGQQFELTPAKYLKLAQHFVASSFVAPSLMPRHELKAALKRAEEMLWISLNDENNRKYLKHWLKINDFLSSMKRAKVDVQALNQLVHQKDAESSKTLQSFYPDESGYAKKVIYNMSDSVTGRAKVMSGPQILTTMHEVRSCIRSSFNDGKVLLVDFRSIEPRIAMITVGKQAPDDVYADLLEEFPDISRQAAKLATLVALYGGKDNRINGVLGDLGRARKAVSFVKSHFRVEKIERMLQEQADLGMVRNVLGRPLREAVKNARIRTNHFLQSSAAELAPLLFAELCKKFSRGVRPLFMIHDALIVDVESSMLEKFNQEAEKIEWNENKMPVKVEILSPT